MIALLCAAILLPEFKVLEIVDEKSSLVVIEAIIPALPTMGDREQAAWNVLSDALYDGTDEFSRDRLQDFGSQAGVPISIEAFPDFMKIQIVEPKGGLKVGSQILESLLRRPSLTDSAVLESRTRLKKQRSGVWERALFDQDLPYEKVTTEMVKNLALQAFRPDRIVFVFGGEMIAAAGKAEVESRFSGTLQIAPRRARFDQLPRQWTKHFEPVSTIEVRGEPLSLSSDKGLASALAVFALGVGKDGTMHRVLREVNAWSYRQEAVLWPTLQGWVPRLLFANGSTPDASMLVSPALEALQKDIGSWTADTLGRAKAMFLSSLDGTNPLCPFWTDVRGPMRATLEDKCDWAGINLMQGSVQDTSSFVRKLDTVTLKEMQESARQLLETSRSGVIPGTQSHSTGN